MTVVSSWRDFAKQDYIGPLAELQGRFLARKLSSLFNEDAPSNLFGIQVVRRLIDD